jgi:hypothetical protein
MCMRNTLLANSILKIDSVKAPMGSNNGESRESARFCSEMHEMCDERRKNSINFRCFSYGAQLFLANN